jgi:cell division septation protein DedD
VGEKYFEIIITARQLGALLAGLVLLVGGAFGFGVVVGRLEPNEAPVQVVAAETLPTPVPAVAASVPTPVLAPTATAAPALAAAPTVAPVVTATKSAPTQTPRPAPTRSPTVADVPPAGAGMPRWVQVVVVSKSEQAEGARQRVIALGYTTTQASVQPVAGGKFRVRVGPFPDEESAGRVAARLRAQGFTGAFLVKPGE